MLGTLAGSQPAPPKLASVRCIQYQSRHYSCHVTRKSLVYTHTCDQGCPQANRGDHFNPTSASTNPRQNPHSRVLRFPRTSPAGSFFGGFRTPAPAQAAPSPWAGIQKPAQKRTSRGAYPESAFVAKRRPICSAHRPQTARAICSGLIGVELNSILRWDNASQTPFAITTGGAIALPSPTPLTPNGFRGDGKCICFSSMCGTSLAPGTR